MRRGHTLLSRIIVKLGAPEGQPPAFYKDMALGFAAVPALFVLAVLGSEMKFTRPFWMAAVVAVACQWAATKKHFLFAGFLFVAGFRFIIAFMLTANTYAGMFALACFLALGVLLAFNENDY